MISAGRLLKSTELRADESIQSLAIRLAPFCLTSVDEFLRYGLGMNTKLSSLPSDVRALERLAEIGGFDAEEVQRRTVKWTSTGYLLYGRKIPHHWVSTNTRRLAPGVLFNDDLIPFHRLAWQVNALECDVETGEALVGQCPRCCATLTWNNIEGIAVCGTCRFDLRKHQPRYVPDAQLEFARELHSYLLCTSACLPAPFDQADDITVCFAMEWFGSIADHRGDKALQPSCKSAAAGLAAIRAWPRSFEKVLRRCAANGSAPSGLDVGRIIPFLVDAIEKAGTSFLRHILLERATKILGERLFLSAS